ncbi:AF4/FMR2 family member 1-like isoform X2 [Mugil cephalus]|uniref:AF4/FMR2 family member 1-like isoform X2 n=1 Tax=Mugil cephalus TaxID=48193 RepID=UPI001FB70419|nr:AF4/FMR2 family member 1-like isoform X2 [Mugil cephalus]
MASQPSVYNEERNLLRLRAWEQRNQEASQTKELNPDNVPLFGEPYKTNKGDELSNRIRRMLGSYEDVNNPCPISIEASPAPTYVTFSQPDQGQPNTDKLTKPPFHNQALYTQSQRGPSSNGCSSQPTRTSAASSPNHHGHASAFPKPLSHLELQQKTSVVLSDLREPVDISQEMLAQSPDVKPLPFLHSSDHINTHTKDTSEGHQLQGCADESALNIKQSPKDAFVPQVSKTSALPSQTFPPLLSSKQANTVMTQKPTAYVRPMDGQDQMVSESPELKPSPEPYTPLPEVIIKSKPEKTNVIPQISEKRTEKSQCVEDILREMTHSWPPLLTALPTPSADEASKSKRLKEAEDVSSCAGKKSHNSSSGDSSHLNQQSSSFSVDAAHTSDVDATSSSDSDSSSGSESDSESTVEESPQPPADHSVKTEPDSPAVSHGDWQLGNWIRSSQPNSEGQSSAHVPKSLAHKRLLPTQGPERRSVEVVDPTAQPKLQISSHQKENLSIKQEFTESPQDNSSQHSSQKSLSADVKSCTWKPSKSAEKGCVDHAEAAVGVKCEEVVTVKTKEPCFTDRPKVKTKACKKSKGSTDSKKDRKRTKSLDKQKNKSQPGPEVALVLYGHCLSCGVRYPNLCSCTTKSPAQHDQLSPVPPVRISCSKPKADAICQRGNKTPQKTTHKHLEKSGHTAKGSQELHEPPKTLLVKIDLSLLSRVPKTSNVHLGAPSKAKRSALVIEKDGAQTHKRSKSSKKSTPQNVEADNKTLPRKKQKLEKNTSSTHVSMKLESSSNPAEAPQQKKAKKNPAAAKDQTKDSKLQQGCSGKTQGSNKEAAKSKDSHKHKRSGGKHAEHPRHEKKHSKSSAAVTSSSQPTTTNRPLLPLEDSCRQYPVKHYIKEAKRLKHKADAESDKLSKAFNYLDAAMFFVESGIAMEKDPQISMSSYTMFAETVELLKFVLKLKNTTDPSAPPPEKDFLALCLKCQSLLQMAMFHHKHKTALKYSKLLSDHFNTTHSPVCSSKVGDNPSPRMLSPASASVSSGPGSNHSGSGIGPAPATVAIPQAVEQVAFTYVNITTLFLSAHDIWEQAEELARRGSGMLAELDTVMGPLSLTSTMSCMVRYTRQGVHWLRLDSQKV